MEEKGQNKIRNQIKDRILELWQRWNTPNCKMMASSRLIIFAESMKQLEADYKKNLTKFQGNEREVGKPRESLFLFKLSYEGNLSNCV